MPSLRPLLTIPALAWAATVGLAGCTGHERVVMRFQELSCVFAGQQAKYGKCIEPFTPDDPPRFCYQTLGRVDCYAEPVRFGPDLGWQRAAPPDLVP